MSRLTLHRGLAAVTALLALAVAAGPSVAARADEPSSPPSGTPYLPRPTGPDPVGATSLYLKDTSRPDPWVPGSTARELMVSLWYPTKPSNGPRARYMTPAESQALLEDVGITGIPLDVLSTVRTNAVAEVMFLGKPATYTPGSGRPEAAAWERDWQRLTGWKRWLLVDGTVHTSFNDIGVLVEELGIDFGTDMPGARSLDITRNYVRAFFDLHLRNKPQPLLDQPTARYPEVKFCSPETNNCS